MSDKSDNVSKKKEKPIRMFIKKIDNSNYKSQIVTVKSSDSDSYEINRFMPQLEESTDRTIPGTVPIKKPERKISSKAGKVSKRRNSEYHQKKRTTRVPQPHEQVKRIKRTENEILNDRFREFREKQKEELNRIQAEKLQQIMNQEEHSSTSSAMEIERENQEPSLQLQASISTSKPVTDIQPNVVEKQKQDIFKVPEMIKGNVEARKFPRVKTVLQDFFRVSNIAYALTKLHTLFKCCSSICDFKTTDETKFKDHLISHPSPNPTLKSQKRCNICCETIEAVNLLEEFSHMKTFHLNRNETLSDLISSLNGSTEPNNDLITNATHSPSSVFNTPPYTKEDETRVYDEVELKLQKLFKDDHKKLEFSDLPKEKQSSAKKPKIMSNEKPTLKNSNCPPTRKNLSPLKIKETNATHKSLENEGSSKQCDKIISEEISRTLRKEQVGSLPTPKENVPHENMKNASHSKHLQQPRQQREISTDVSSSCVKKFKRSLSVTHLVRTIETKKPRLQNEEIKTKTNNFVQQLIEKEKSSKSPALKSPRDVGRPPSYQQARVDVSPTTTEASMKNSNKFKTSSQPPEKNGNEFKSTSTAPCTSSPINQIIVRRQHKIASPTQLMPWISLKFLRQNEKLAICFMKMLRKSSLIANFKCMGRMCSFTTSDHNLFISHLGFHDDKKPNNFTLFCSYCTYKGKDAKELTRHIFNIHTKDIFQCPKCFYRSREKLTCYEHIQQQHGDENLKILECPVSVVEDKYEKTEQLMMERLRRKRSEFVQHIRCKFKECELKYYLLEDLVEHLKIHAKSENERERKSVEETMTTMQQTFDSNAYGMVQCLFCLHGAADEELISKHMVEHPSEPNYCCIRKRPPGVVNASPFSIESTNIHRIVLPRNIKVELFQGSIVSLTSDNFKRVIDRSLEAERIRVDSNSSN